MAYTLTTQKIKPLDRQSAKHIKQLAQAKGALSGAFYVAMANGIQDGEYDDEKPVAALVVTLQTKDKQGVKALAQGKKLVGQMNKTPRVARGTIAYTNNQLVFTHSIGKLKAGTFVRARKQLIRNSNARGATLGTLLKKCVFTAAGSDVQDADFTRITETALRHDSWSLTSLEQDELSRLRELAANYESEEEALQAFLTVEDDATAEAQAAKAYEKELRTLKTRTDELYTAYELDDVALGIAVDEMAAQMATPGGWDGLALWEQINWLRAQPLGGDATLEAALKSVTDKERRTLEAYELWNNANEARRSAEENLWGLLHDGTEMTREKEKRKIDKRFQKMVDLVMRADTATKLEEHIEGTTEYNEAWSRVEITDIPQEVQTCTNSSGDELDVYNLGGTWHIVPEDWIHQYTFFENDDRYRPINFKRSNDLREGGLDDGEPISWAALIGQWPTIAEGAMSNRDSRMLKYCHAPRDGSADTNAKFVAAWCTSAANRGRLRALREPVPRSVTEQAGRHGKTINRRSPQAQPVFWARLGFDTLVKGYGRCLHNAGVAFFTLCLDPAYDGLVIESVGNPDVDHHFLVIGRHTPGKLRAAGTEPEDIDALGAGGFCLDNWEANCDQQNSGADDPTRATRWEDFAYKHHELVMFSMAFPDKRAALRAELITWLAEVNANRTAALQALGLDHLIGTIPGT